MVWGLGNSRLDDALIIAISTLGLPGMFDDALILRRLRIPSRMRGGGHRSRVWLAPVAWASGRVEAAEHFIDCHAPDGSLLRAGCFPHLSSLFGAGAFDQGGQRFSQALQAPLALGSTLELASVWRALQTQYTGYPYGTVLGAPGPLDTDAGHAGLGRGEGRLQRLITTQCEQVMQDRLHHEFASLTLQDPRRRAWMAADCLSSQLITAIPTEALDCTADEFREMYTTYFGVPSPACLPLVGRAIPSAPVRQLDPYGFELDSACMRFAVFDICHDALRDFMFDVAQEVGIRVQWEPRFIFQTLIPPAVLMAPGGRPGVIPDLAFAARMPSISTGRRDVRGASQTERVLLWDVKTLHSGATYLCPRARDEQTGAVAERAHRVWPAYLAHAHTLDLRYHAPSSPIEARLRSYTPTRALVFGQYAEASQDVHTLLEYLARHRATAQWCRYGARSVEEAYGFFIAALRRRVGVFAAREMARHRLRRIPFVGVPRAAVVAYTGRPQQVVQDRAQIAAHDFYAFQIHAAVGRAVGG